MTQSQSPTGAFRRAFGHKLPEAWLATLRTSAETKQYPAGTILCRQGEQGDTFFVLVSGRAVAAQKREDGEDRVLNVIKEGQFFGEMALLDNTARMATVAAVTDVVVVELDETTFDRLVARVPAVATGIMRRVVQLLRETDRQAIADLKVKNAELLTAYEELKVAQAAIIEKERMEHELALAAEMQRSLLPLELPERVSAERRYQFASYLKTAREVGGDFYDVVDLDPNRAGVLLADVADKGTQAALFMAVARTLFHSEARVHDSPAAVAEAVHHTMMSVASTHETFVTAFYGVVELDSGRLTYVRAAQERPVLLRPGQPPVTLPGDGRFLGMLPDLTLESFSAELLPGDRLLIFSDGLPDAVNPAGERYGYDRLMALLANCGLHSAEALVAAVVEDVEQFSAEAAPYDDLTLLAMAVDPLI